ncbi:MAG: ATP-binding protein [Azospira oryzae]|jgi:two-component system nitrogen regulation sensor histidine kinase NtrY|nr:MAG: ATP-binding protein [Azospira oryzae]
MVFKNFRFNIILRVLLLFGGTTLFAWCSVNGYPLRCVYIATGVLVLLIELIWYLERFNRDVKNFMSGLLQRDFTTRYQSLGQGNNYDELFEILNRISDEFKKISTEKEIQHRYLEVLVEHLRIGIISIDANEKVHLANQALKDLLQKNIITHLHSFQTLDPSFISTLKEIRSGETRLVKLKVNNELLQLSIHASEFKLEEKYYKLISMQNIRNELDIREMEAWQKLIRVLSHEIMNSVAPIISLSSTLHGLVAQSSKSLRSEDETLYNSLDKGLEAIKTRSEGLSHFTQTYRKLTGVPQLVLKEVNLKDILGRVTMLMQSRLSESNVHLSITNADVPLTADPELMEHVLINLIINAIEAADKAHAFIRIYSSRNQKGNVLIHIKDNGSGMDESTMEKIFIPFFTTKKYGSGIGLALSKQILQLHHADIHLSSEPDKGTEFIIVL